MRKGSGICMSQFLVTFIKSNRMILAFFLQVENYISLLKISQHRLKT